MTRKRKKKSANMGFKIILFVVIFFCACGVFDNERKIYRVQKENVATQARIDKLKAEQQELTAERKRLDDPKYIEKLARENYNMVGKNEVPLFIVEDGNKAEQK